MKKKAEQLLRRAHLALHLGISAQRVDSLVASKKLKRRADKMFDLADPVNASFIASRRISATAAKEVVRGKRGAKMVDLPRQSASPAGSPPAGPIVWPPVPDIPRNEIERLRALASLEKLRLQNAKATGRLVERPSVFAFASHLVSILNSEFLSLGQRLATDLSSIARKADSDDSAAVAIDAFLQPELYAIVQHATSTTRKFCRELYDETSGEVAGPVQLTAALQELRGMIDTVIAEVKNKREAAA